jgi:hypothetical protein
MEIDVKKLIGNLLTENEIIINDLSTYPKEITDKIETKVLCEDDLQNFFYKSKYNVVGVHLTRLFNYEIDDIKINGLNSDSDISYRKKILNMPSEFDKYKNELIKFVCNQNNKRSNGYIYFDVGKIQIDICNEIFLKNWGGETLYCYYDHLRGMSKYEKQLAAELRKKTIPCAIIIKANAYTFFTSFLKNEDLLENMLSGNIQDYRNECCVEQSYVKVIDVVPVKNLKVIR